MHFEVPRNESAWLERRQGLRSGGGYRLEIIGGLFGGVIAHC